MIEVIGSRIVMFWHGAGDDRGRPSQVTAIGYRRDLTGDRVVLASAFVREGLKTRSIDHFVMSSGARLGHKADADRVPGVEILELAAPRELWNEIAAEVHELDALKREVRRNARWSLDNAARIWRDGARRAHW